MIRKTSRAWLEDIRERMRSLRIGIGEPITLDEIEYLLEEIARLDIVKAPTCECCS